MKLGLLTAAFPDLTLEQVADWAGANGVRDARDRVLAGPAVRRGATRASRTSMSRASTPRARRRSSGCSPRAGSRSRRSRTTPTTCTPTAAHRAEVNAHLGASSMPPRCSASRSSARSSGADPARSLTENLRSFAEVWPALVDRARGKGVKIAIENCPMLFSGDEWPFGTNLARTPHIWREMFNVIPDAGFGLNLDPSHLVWQMIDYERVVYDFGDRILHVHAKDMEIDRDGLYEHGVLSAGMNWQVPRLPGLGEVRWDRFCAALYGVGYDRWISIEHEDRASRATWSSSSAGS